MSFAQDSGYTPVPFNTLMDFLRQGVNEQFLTAYTTETFVGTNFYKYFYALAQKSLENETKTAEIFQKYQQYIALTNEKIQRPSVSMPGIIDSFASKGYVASVKPPVDADAGKISICVDLDSGASDYADKKLEVCTLIKEFIAGGIVSQGDQVESITLDNGQSFDYKFSLPNPTPVLLKLTAVESENNLLAVPSDEVLRQTVFDQVNARYRLGWNFEPQRYFTLSDAPWAGEVTLEYSDDDGETWSSDIFDASYTDLFTFGLEDIEVVIS